MTPGPNVIVVTLIGYHVAGLAGALVATLAMCGPTCIFAFFVGALWERFKDARWRMIIQAGLVPVSLGLIAASALVIARVAAQHWVPVAVDGGDRRGHLQAAGQPALDFRGRGVARARRGGLRRACNARRSLL